MKRFDFSIVKQIANQISSSCKRIIYIMLKNFKLYCRHSQLFEIFFSIISHYYRKVMIFNIRRLWAQIELFNLKKVSWS